MSRTPRSQIFLLPSRAGGHTTEMLAMMSGLDFDRYSPRLYVISEGDTLSAQKAVTLEEAKDPRLEVSSILD